jgi:hypothetical protein
MAEQLAMLRAVVSSTVQSLLGAHLLNLLGGGCG